MKRMNFVKSSQGLTCAIMALTASLHWLAPTQSCLSDEVERPHVLFIAVDDLRPELNCYGQSHIHSPNIDRLATEGVLFERAYCMVSVCGASRASLMTGIRPSRNRFVNYLTSAEDDAPGVITMNTHFRENGYHTISLGKVFHRAEDNAHGWTDPVWRPSKVPAYHLPENQRLHRMRQREGERQRGPAWEAADAPDNAYADGKIAERAVAELERLSKGDQPFFLAVGFLKPHLPFVAPKKYWDLYSDQTIGPPRNYFVPTSAPQQSLHTSGELRSYAGIPSSGPVSDESARNLLHGYFACVSFTDAQIGLLLDALDRFGLANKTIVVLWSDHGWNLGEHSLWCKHSCYETSMRIPLIVKVPDVDGGQKRNALIESIDIYPTLCDLTRLPSPEHLEGMSFAELMKSDDVPWKDAAVGRYMNGDTIRTDRYRYSEFTRPEGHRVAEMMYDHKVDPDENINVASIQSNAAASLRKRLHTLQGRDAPVQSETSD